MISDANGVHEDNMDFTERMEGGHRPYMYHDSKGIPTIGIGLNMQDKWVKDQLTSRGYDVQNLLDKKSPLKEEDAREIFGIRMEKATQEAAQFVGLDTWNALSQNRKDVLTDMSYNMGLPTLSQFKGLKSAVQRGDWNMAEQSMKNSKWAKDVHDRRVGPLVHTMLTG